MTTTATRRLPATTSAVEVALRVLATAGLGVSAYVHLHLAHLYTGLGNSITQGDLFYAQGALAVLVAVVLLVTGNRWVWRVAGLLAAASFGAVMLYKYVNVGTIGPLPNMYDPTWFPSPDKALSAVVEAAVFVLWVVHEAVRRTRR